MRKTAGACEGKGNTEIMLLISEKREIGKGEQACSRQPASQGVCVGDTAGSSFQVEKDIFRPNMGWQPSHGL